MKSSVTDGWHDINKLSVQSGFVENAIDYPYSSARGLYR